MWLLVRCLVWNVSGSLSVPVARELVLDYIAERKRMDDLCCSITDGRFREQKVLFINLVLYFFDGRGCIKNCDALPKL